MGLLSQYVYRPCRHGMRKTALGSHCKCTCDMGLLSMRGSQSPAATSLEAQQSQRHVKVHACDAKQGRSGCEQGSRLLAGLGQVEPGLAEVGRERDGALVRSHAARNVAHARPTQAQQVPHLAQCNVLATSASHM